MSAESRCSFCLRLPKLTQRRRATSAHCPVCHGDLLITGDGSKYRCDAALLMRHPRTRRIWLAGGTALFALVALVWQFLPSPQLPLAPTTETIAQAGKAIPARPRLPFVEVISTQETPTARQQAPSMVEGESGAAVPPGTVKSRPRRVLVAVAKLMTVVPTLTAPEPAAPSLWTRTWSTEDLQKQLQRIPEVTLLNYAGSAARQPGLGEAFSLQQLTPLVKQHKDKLLDHLLTKRAELAELPLLKGKDCQLESKAAAQLLQSSLRLRGILAEFVTGPRSSRNIQEPEQLQESSLFKLGYQLASRPELRAAGAVPALEQILTGESPTARLALVRHLHYPAEAGSAPRVLVRRALFDTAAAVRQEAILGLRWLANRDHLPLLLKGLQHPWAPANYHAAQALVALHAEAAIPELVKLLDAPDPTAPVEVEQNGKKVLAVRELVRINHNANCLLCHAPAQERTGLVRVAVPSPSQQLPPRFSPVYYENRESTSGLFVRADITYLRQDFSEVQAVENPGKWPKQQRFDFLVRTRPLTEKEATAWRQREQLVGPQPLPAAREAALFALRELTGVDGGLTAASWRKALADRPQITAAK